MKSSSPLSLSEAIYTRLLILYPRRFRHEYGREMALVFRDQYRQSVRRSDEGALVTLWLSTLGDLLTTAPAERMKEGIAMSKTMWVQLSGLFAILGGLLGLYLLTFGPNFYGNYGWHGELAPVAGILLALGLSGWFALGHERMNGRGWTGFAISMIGLLSLAAGYFTGQLWFMIFIGPLIFVPIGATMLGSAANSLSHLPAWWRLFPFAVAAASLVGFAIEMDEVIAGNSTPDRGLMTTELLFSMLWLGLGISLWLFVRRDLTQPNAL